MTKSNTVLVTGAAKRLGRAIAIDLAHAGWSVVVHYNAPGSDAEETAKAIRAVGARAWVAKANLENEDETDSLIARVVAEAGPLTALVNSASIFENDDWTSATRESWQAHMQVNLRAPFVLAQEFARQLPADAKGAIVNILDQRVFKPTPQFLSYSLSKAGLHWLTTTLAQALAPRVRVNAVAPGPTMINARQSEEDFRRQREATLLSTGSEPGDITAAVRYLLDAKAVTGQTIVADGGQHLVWQTPDVSVTE